MPGNSRERVWTDSSTWNSGDRERSRSGRSSSTSVSNGRSWRSNAASALSRTWRSRSRKVEAAPRSARNTSVLTKKPISPSVSARLRLAIGEPTSTSSCPE